MSEASGISQGTKVSKHGLRASHTADVFLDDCRVPAGYVLGAGGARRDQGGARLLFVRRQHQTAPVSQNRAGAYNPAAAVQIPAHEV
jgi:alkylation response protein AidB-like acyl-CoA dehydrogenase